MVWVQVLYWKEIPSQIKVWDEQGEEKILLPQRFQEAIDTLAMIAGEEASDAYLEGWHWGEEFQREGLREAVVQQVVTEIEKEWPEERLRALLRAAREERG